MEDEEMWGYDASIEEMKGAVLLGWVGGDEQIKVLTNRGVFIFQHEQECCESVTVEEDTGWSEDCVGEVVILAEEGTDRGSAGAGTRTYTVYTISTQHHEITMTWKGESNGYYSESVSVYKYPLSTNEYEALSDKAKVVCDMLLERGVPVSGL